MKYLPQFALLPKNPSLLNDINSAAFRLFNKLVNIDKSRLDISDYTKRYLNTHLGKLQSTLQKYAYILSWSLNASPLHYKKLVFLEYGGGCGILSLLAKELGVMTVIYNDIYDVSCKDAKHLAEYIQNQADWYVKGNIEDVISFLNARSINCHVIASYDVIEHIYDIDGFLKRIPAVSNGPLAVMLSSGANMYHPYIKRVLQKTQVKVENERQKRS